MIIGVVILVILAFGYFYMSGDTAPADESTLQVQVANTDGARILSLLHQIRSLKIDTSIFSSDAYESLEDYSVAIPETAVGRANPFAPIPGFVLPSPTPAR